VEKRGKDTELTERQKKTAMRLALGKVIAAVGTPVRGSRREGTSCGLETTGAPAGDLIFYPAPVGGMKIIG